MPFALRRLPPGALARWLRVVALSTAGFTALDFALTSRHPAWHTAKPWLLSAGANLVFALAITLAIHAAYWLVRRALGPRWQGLADWQRGLYYWATPLAGLAVGYTAAAWATGAHSVHYGAPQLHVSKPGMAVFSLLVVGLFYGFYAVRARQLAAERRAAQAQLQLLQGQMEPHFLFNTLANVVGLMEHDTPRAKAMLESFTDYLRASLGGLRQPEHPLANELALVEAYLRIAAVRMEGRFAYAIDVPEPLRALPVPALSLQPLVENAVLHGLEPSVQGGRIRVQAARQGAQLVLRVEDDGVGLGHATHGNGTALDNLRARLQQVYGDGARCTVEAAQPAGTRATLVLPLREPAA